MSQVYRVLQHMCQGAMQRPFIVQISKTPQ